MERGDARGSQPSPVNEGVGEGGRGRRKGRKPRRGRGKKTENGCEQSLVIVHSNLRGFTSKKESVKNVADLANADIVTLNETGLRNRNKVNIPGYISFSRNRKEKSMGGVSTSVKLKFKPHTVNIKEGAGEDEYLITRLDHCYPALCIINVYGEQEGRTSREEILDRWIRLRKDLEEIKNRGDMLLVIGDMNKLVGCDELGVVGNHEKFSYGGQLIRELLASGEFVMVNNTELATGGPFTWMDSGDMNRKSCLDLVLCCRKLLPYIKSLLIDSERKFAMKRVIYRSGKLKTVFADHYTLVLRLENLPGVKVKSEKSCYWNLCKEGGWEEYKRISDEKSETIDKLVEDTALDIDEVMDKVEKIQDKIKFGAFGKTTKKMRNKPNVMDTAMSNEAEDIINKQRRVAEEHLRNLSECNQGRVGKIFQIRKSIQGCKKGAMEAQAVKDPLTGKLAVSNKEIQEVSLNYCKSVLMNNEPRDEYKREVMMKEQIHEERKKENAGSGFEVTRELFDKVVKKFKSNNKRSYDFILNGGDKFKELC